MLEYAMDLEDGSSWLRTTLDATSAAQAFTCTEAGRFLARRDFFTRRSYKESYLFFYTIAGSGTLEQGGRSVTIPAGSALLVDCREEQEYGTTRGAALWHHIWAHVDGTGISAMVEAGAPALLHPVEMDEHLVRRCFSRLEASLPVPLLTARLEAGLATHELLCGMASSPVERRQESHTTEVVRKACELVDERLSDDLSIDDLARAANVSVSYLLRLFKRQTGTTPYSYLMTCRVTRAKELLTQTDLPIGTISKACGFSSESNFSFRFSKMVGESPTSYRRSSPLLPGADPTS